MLRWRSPPVMDSRGILKFDRVESDAVSFMVVVDVTAKNTLVENVVRGWRKDMDDDVATLFEGEFPGEFRGGQVSWVTSKPWTRNLASGKPQLE